MDTIVPNKSYEANDITASHGIKRAYNKNTKQTEEMNLTSQLGGISLLSRSNLNSFDFFFHLDLLAVLFLTHNLP